MFIRKDPRRRTARAVAGSVAAVLVGIAMVVGAVLWGVGATRVYLEPTARVRVVCYEVDHSCPASWTSHGRTVQGTADDPYSGHRYSRVVHDALFHRTTLTLHVSGNRAAMTPNWDTLPGAAFLLLWGVGIGWVAVRRLRGMARRRVPVNLGAHELR